MCSRSDLTHGLDPGAADNHYQIIDAEQAQLSPTFGPMPLKFVGLTS
jgi:hypothetical protein